jgi:glycosyltransferase involved in cell wall biosynthesis
MPKHTVIIQTPQELSQSSYIQTGFFELKRMGIIDLKTKISTKKRLGRVIVSNTGEITETKQAHPKTSFYQLINNIDNTALFFACDLYDFANHFSKEALEKCDFIFKRSYESRYVDALPKGYKHKVFPLGLIFPVHSPYKKQSFKFLIGLLLSNCKVNFKWDRFVFNRLYKTINAQQKHWKFVNTTRKLDRFENFELGVNNSILFQTRCFLYDKDQDVKEIHQQRYRIIKLLRQNFPNHFMGGFVPSKISKEKYGDALTNVPSEPEKYLNVLKNSKIVIYTRGLANSPAWKMAEYLSQGKVIIAERLTTELPKPLIHGKELLFFDTDEELIVNINKVLEDDNLSESLSKNARNYFEVNIHPAQNIKRILDIMINRKND